MLVVFILGPFLASAVKAFDCYSCITPNLNNTQVLSLERLLICLFQFYQATGLSKPLSVSIYCCGKYEIYTNILSKSCPNSCVFAQFRYVDSAGSHNSTPFTSTQHIPKGVKQSGVFRECLADVQSNAFFAQVDRPMACPDIESKTINNAEARRVHAHLFRNGLMPFFTPRFAPALAEISARSLLAHLLA